MPMCLLVIVFSHFFRAEAGVRVYHQIGFIWRAETPAKTVTSLLILLSVLAGVLLVQIQNYLYVLFYFF